MAGLARNITVPKDQVLDEPIEMVHQEDALCVLVLEENSEACLVEHFSAVNDNCNVYDLKIILKEGARLSHFRMQNASSLSSHHATVHVQIEKDAYYSAFQFDLGGKDIKTHVNVDLNAQGARSDLYGLYLLDGVQCVENDVLISHHVSDGMSRQAYKGILQGYSHGEFTGKVYVHRGAEKTQADQANHNILLSNQAKMNFRPELEIYADDVSCTHGATVGELDDNAVFYLKSRGIEEKAARRILLRGFVGEILDAFDNACISDKKIDSLRSSFLNIQKTFKPVIEKRIASLL